MNKKLLQSFMAKYGDTQSTLAAALGISLSRLNAKINGYNGADFNQSEITFIAKRYGMTAEDLMACFFTLKASD